ncbi:hypothetical protein AAU57_06925 [Nonlabens sp. YIK11]|uniref:hypothetical protein n=1 Tax=Nonlabens sp. YIK11 TaxID=1453349 RepID=UPI0006DD257A|nr:hypothetical protein [Nonlabens sp. YIK11]KQC33077.1 hypothetical protein AAU57_06925 [Nonlabens sp. YIK11]
MDEASWIQFKTAIHNKCLEIVQQQLDTIQSSMDQLMEAKSNETKSSAGDKYETGMAMIQNQEDLYRRQHMDTASKLQLLKSIDPTVTHQKIDQGSLVELSTGWFYISVALGKLDLNEREVFVLSLQSPLGILLKGRSAGDQVTFNGKQIIVKTVH